MRPRERLVIDTNALISRFLLPRSIPGQAVRKTINHGRVLVSESTLNELASVLSRLKFDSYVSINSRQSFLRHLGRIAEMVEILQPIRVCRDLSDDKFLEVAVNGEAAIIITGDQDLLVLHPFLGISIVTPADYLSR